MWAKINLTKQRYDKFYLYQTHDSLPTFILFLANLSGVSNPSKFLTPTYKMNNNNNATKYPVKVSPETSLNTKF